MTTSMDQQSQTASELLSKGSQYRQTIYHDPLVGFITESCCRPRAICSIGSFEKTPGDWTLYPPTESLSSLRAPGGHLWPECWPAKVLRPVRSQDHVTVAKLKKKKVTVEVVQSTSEHGHKARPSMASSAGPSTPQAPRPARLPTPDLSDCEDGDFCDCGTNIHIIKLCTLCNKRPNNHNR